MRCVMFSFFRYYHTIHARAVCINEMEKAFKKLNLKVVELTCILGGKIRNVQHCGNMAAYAE